MLSMSRGSRRLAGLEAPAEDRPAEDVQQGRPEEQPDQDFAEHRRLADPVGRRAGQLGGRRS